MTRSSETIDDRLVCGRASGQPASGSKPVPATLDSDRLTNLEMDLVNLKEIKQGPGVSPASLRRTLIDQAKKSIAASYGTTPEELRSSGIHRRVWGLVLKLVPMLPSESGPKPIPDSLDAGLVKDIKSELMDMKGASPGVSAPLLRPRLMAKAETLAAESLGIGPRDLNKHLTLRHQIRDIVNQILPANTPSRPVSVPRTLPADTTRPAGAGSSEATPNPLPESRVKRRTTTPRTAVANASTAILACRRHLLLPYSRRACRRCHVADGWNCYMRNALLRGPLRPEASFPSRALLPLLVVPRPGRGRLRRGGAVRRSRRRAG